MLLDLSDNELARLKLINAIIYFAQNTKRCHKIKLFKLLYFLDFIHFREIGRTVTGSTYQAWYFGPVPIELYKEFEKPKEDLKKSVTITKEKHKDKSFFKIKPNDQFNIRAFSRREMQIMQDLVVKYRDSDWQTMVDETHLENRPWDKIYQNGKGKNRVIPYELALREDEKEQILDFVKEHEDFEKAFKQL